MGGRKSSYFLRDCRFDLRVYTKLGFHANGARRQNTATPGLSIHGYAKRYRIVQGDYLYYVAKSMSTIKKKNRETNLETWRY